MYYGFDAENSQPKCFGKLEIKNQEKKIFYENYLNYL